MNFIHEIQGNFIEINIFVGLMVHNWKHFI